MVDVITEKKMVERDVIVGKKIICDCCRKVIAKTEENKSINVTYYEVTTGHNDWGNDSCDSIEKFYYCSEQCLHKAFMNYYLAKGKVGSAYFNVTRKTECLHKEK